MATTLWGTDTASPFVISADPLAELNPAVADSGGGSFGVAWTSSAGVTVRFYDVVGAVDPALGTIVLTDHTNAQNVSLTAGGAVGYAATWEEGSTLFGRYVGLAGPVGAAFQIDATAGFVQHDAVMAGYAVDGANGKPVIDGFNVVWVSTDTASGAPAGYGQIMLQRFAVPLDARVDPIGPPVAAGLDGTTAGSNAAFQVAALGRDPSTIVTHDGETVITWIDTNNQIHLRAFDLGGNEITNGIGIVGGGSVNDLDGSNPDTGAGVTPGFQAKIVDLAGAGFVVAWVGQETLNLPPPTGPITVPEIRAVVFAPGATPGTYTAAQPIRLDFLPEGFAGDFSLGTLVDSGGFSLSYTATNPNTNAGDVFVHAFDSAGASLGAATALTLPANQTSSALAGLVGDRIVAVYQDTQTGNADIGAAILDTRAPGLTLNGDDVDLGRPRARADVLVGTVGDDTLNGFLADDELHGAIGNDRLVGGVGDDILDGGSGIDTAVFTGISTDYIITYLGGDLFTIEDAANPARDGIDTLRGVENFEFTDTTKTALEIITGIQPVTPTPWGWSNEDPDSAPNGAGTPDVDGFLVNHADAKSGAKDTNAFVADSVGEFLGVVWEHTAAGGTESHIQGQFYDVIGAFDAFLPNVTNLSDGVGIETNPVIVSGGANSGWGIAFEQLDTDLVDADGNPVTDTTHAIRTNFVGPGFLTGPEQTVLVEQNVDQHDAAMSGSFLDRTLADPIGGSALPRAMNEGYNVVWVSTHLDGADGTLPEGYGRIMMQRYEVPLDALGNPGAPVGGGVDGIAGLDGLNLLAASDGTDEKDAAFWVGRELGTTGGVIGRNPSTTALHGFETIVTWIETVGGVERVAGRAYDDLGHVISVPGLDNISAGFDVAAGTTQQVVSAGAVNFGVVWVTEIDGKLTVMGNMYAPTGAGLNGEGFGFSAPAPFTLFELPDGATAEDLQLSVTGISGEDSEDLVVSWKSTSTSDGADMMAQHIKVALDPVTGLVIAMGVEGDAVTVNAETTGNQEGGTLAGLLGDRFIGVYQDDNPTYTDGSDIVARIFDTRDAVNPDPIVGDLIRNGTVQARRDVLIGTNGDDHIRGDIDNANGLVDYIFSGMGDDVIQGGPGLRGAAGIPEIIDGGQGFDIAVYTGRLQDYSITINGDGSFEVIDLRPVQDAQGNPLINDGIDNIYNMEMLRFLNLTQDNPNPTVPPQVTEIGFGFPGTPPPLNHINGIDQGVYTGTPVPWSLDDTTPAKEIAVDAPTAPALDARSGINVINLQDGAALSWISGTHEVWAISYDTTGKADPVFLAENTKLSDATFTDNTVADIDVAMTGGLGFTAVWESTDGAVADVNSDGVGDTSLHMRFASTNTHVVLDPAAGVPGAGLAVDAKTGVGGEIVVVGSDDLGVADGATIQGYEIVNVDNDTLEVGFHVGYVQKDGTEFGELRLARYEIPVYDIEVDAAGLPVLGADGQGALARDAAGNLIPSSVANFGVGSETAPISIGLDGLRGTADDDQAIVLTQSGLLAAGDDRVGTQVVDPITHEVLADFTPIRGRDISIGSLHDGQLVVTYIGDDDKVHLKIYVPEVNQTGDRETTVGLGGVDVVATGITAYSELSLPAPMTAELGLVGAGQTQYIIPQQNGSFGVFWAADDTSTAATGDIAIKGIIYSGAGTNWAASPVTTFASGLSGIVHFQVAPTGVTPGGLEDGFFVSWEVGGAISGQRFDMAGNLVGNPVTVGDPAGTSPLHSSAGIDDGLMLFGYQDESGSVSAQFMDTREPGVPIIGPRTGAPRDVLVGTVGDDAIDGRALADELHGGLGNDLITMGSGADTGFGGLGNDTIIGGSGQDQLLGEAGDDLLWGGLSGPADPKVDRDLVTGLTAAGVDPALIATEPGADIISGGDGIDTLSFQGEFGRFNANLTTGIVLSDRTGSGTFVLEDVIGQIVDDGAGGTIFNFIPDVENLTGGLGDDTLIGDTGNNVLDGGAGTNLIIGGGGSDTVILNGAFANFLISFDAATQTFTLIDQTTPAGGLGVTDIVRDVDVFRFADVERTAAQLVPGPIANPDTATVNEDSSVTFDVRANDTTSQPLHVSAINGTSIVAGGAAIAVAHGQVALGNDGQLTYTPNANFFGSENFSYNVADDVGRFSTSTVAVTVNNVNDAPDDIFFNGLTTTTLSLAENAATNTVVATLSTHDIDNDVVPGTDSFIYTLADNFNGAFKIAGNQIQVQNGTLLDFESAVHSYALNVTVSDGHGGTRSEGVTVNLTNVNEAPVNLALSSASFAETAANGSVIGNLSASDPEGTAVKFALTNDADGRFKVVFDSATGQYKLAVAENLLIDHQTTDANHTYNVDVRAIDAGGLSTLKTFTITATGVAENRVTGTAADNANLTGTGGNDYIDGLAGKDTMTGGGGNDSYIVDNGGDKVVEAANSGTDTIYTTLNSFDLNSAANVENLVFIGTGNFSFIGKASNGSSTVIGGAGADNLQGGNGSDLLEGRGGNDLLQGGNGTDTLIGGAGNDTINGGNGDDTFVFAPGFGNDLVQSFGDVAGNQDVVEIAKGMFTDFGALQAAMVQSGTNVVITDAFGDVLTLQNTTINALGTDDFRFF
jgi:Ca2+-binding RTX toxin-like protein